jgi:hypothetical protein
MTRIYDRETKHYDFALLSHLVETGQATFFEGPAIYVIKTEDGTVAVRPHQVIFTATPAPFEIVVVSPMDGYQSQERFDGEDVGPHGVVFQGALDIAEKFLALDGNPTGIDPLEIVRRILDDETDGYLRLIKNQIAGIPVPPCDQSRRRTGWVSGTEADELVAHFSA